MTAASSEASHIGITVNSFTSVSLDPPLVLWCIDRRSRRYPAFRRGAGLHRLDPGSGPQGGVGQLARPGEHSLDGIDLVPTELGPPALADSLAVFECARESVQDAGDHAILIGRVLRFARNDGAGAPLVYFQGRYGALAQGEPPDGIAGRRATDGLKPRRCVLPATFAQSTADALPKASDSRRTRERCHITVTEPSSSCSAPRR